MSISVQDWSNADFCQQYADTWEISFEEGHYGWLADGENTLRLLADVNLENACVLDIGCGMGENLIVLAKKGVRCFGIDISPHMLEYARKNAESLVFPSQRLTFAVEDMRQLQSFQDIEFDLELLKIPLSAPSAVGDTYWRHGGHHVRTSRR